MNTLVVTENANYIQAVTSLLNKINGNVLLFTCMRPYESFSKGLDKRFVVIDAVTKMLKSDVQNTESCIYVSSPSAFDEMIATAKDLLARKQFDHIVLDSLSSLRVYAHDADSEKFVQAVMGLSDKETLIAMQKDTKSDLVTHISQQVDTVQTC